MYRLIANALTVVRSLIVWAAAQEQNEDDALSLKADADVLSSWIADYERMAAEEAAERRNEETDEGTAFGSRQVNARCLVI